MIQTLKRFILWLEARYPNEVVVLTSDYQKLVADVAESKLLASQAESKALAECNALKAELALLKVQVSSLDKLATDVKKELDVANAVAASLLKPRTLPEIYGPQR